MYIGSVTASGQIGPPVVEPLLLTPVLRPVLPVPDVPVLPPDAVPEAVPVPVPELVAPVDETPAALLEAAFPELDADELPDPPLEQPSSTSVEQARAPTRKRIEGM
jgi:hypothetical protein